jgi:hypothetical protein
VPLVMIAMNLVCAAAACPFGRLSDSMGHHRLLGAGLVMPAASDLVLASSAVAGLLRDGVGTASTFYAGAGYATPALVGLLALRRHG